MPKIYCINLVPPEILTCIFTSLDAKSLGMCKCVSKTWNSLISTPHFIKAHLAKTSFTKLMLLSEPERALYSVHFDNNHHGMDVASKLNFDVSMYCKNKNKITWPRVWGSCDGLVLVEDNSRSMFLLNPTTLESNILPLIPYRYRYNNNTCNLFGFGYDSSCDDYVVTAISYKYRSAKSASVCVYTCKTRRWKGVGTASFDFTVSNDSAGIHVGGLIHWLAKNVNDSSLLIVAFNIANRQFSELPQTDLNSSIGFKRLGIYKGCLCLINLNRRNTIAELWVMKENGVVGSCIKLSMAVDGYSCFVPSEDNLVLMGFCKSVLLISGAKQARVFQYMKVAGSPYSFKVGMTFVETLVSPNYLGEHMNRGMRSRTKQSLK